MRKITEEENQLALEQAEEALIRRVMEYNSQVVAHLGKVYIEDGYAYMCSFPLSTLDLPREED